MTAYLAVILVKVVLVNVVAIAGSPAHVGSPFDLQGQDQRHTCAYTKLAPGRSPQYLGQLPTRSYDRGTMASACRPLCVCLMLFSDLFVPARGSAAFERLLILRIIVPVGPEALLS